MIDCKHYADEILDSITGYGHLAVISVGEDPASMAYIRGKKRDCERVGFGFSHYPFPDDTNMESVLYTIKLLNENPDVTGIIVQLPLPKHLDAEVICNSVAREKDVDGFRPDSPYKPCTPEGVVHILRREVGNLTGRLAVIIGRGKLVGKPLQKMLLNENMTVCICHSHTSPYDRCKLVSMADIVITAIGKPGELCLYTRGDAVVIDCGINRTELGGLCGDVGYCSTKRYTPVPGGVGLMTRAMLMKHVCRDGQKK